MDPVVVLTMFGGAIGGLWLYLKVSNDARITDLKEAHKTDREDWDRERADLKSEIDKRDAKIDRQNDILAQNTTELQKSNENGVILADLVDRMLRELNDRKG